MIFNGPEGIIDKKELHKIKIRIKTYNLPTNYQITSNNIEWDIINPNDVILPRRKSKVLYQLYDIYNCLIFLSWKNLLLYI